MFGLPYVIFRPHNVYGEYQNIADRYRNVVGIFMNQVLRGEAMTVFGDGLQTRAFSYVDDVAPIIARSPLVPGCFNQVFNIGADRPCTVMELAGEVSKAFGVAQNVKHLDPRNEVVHAYSSHEKLRSTFPELTKPISLADGVQRMAAWVKRSGPRPPVEFEDIEITRNLPPSWAKRS
jgi:UDP-glucose 4-epimerase